MGFLTSLASGVWGYVAAAVVAAALAVAGTHALDANHYDTIISTNNAAYLVTQKAESDLAAKAASDNLAKLQSQLDQTTASKAVADKELNDAKLTNDALALSLSTGARRLSVAGSCPAGGGSLPVAAASGPAVHGAQRCDIDPGAAESLVAITRKADITAIKLKQCQAYVLTVTGK